MKHKIWRIDFDLNDSIVDKALSDLVDLLDNGWFILRCDRVPMTSGNTHKGILIYILQKRSD